MPLKTISGRSVVGWVCVCASYDGAVETRLICTQNWRRVDDSSRSIEAASQRVIVAHVPVRTEPVDADPHTQAQTLRKDS